MDKNNLFFYADSHFGHGNIIKHTNRPFVSIADMNETLIKNWNEIVPVNGNIYILGDFIWGGPEYIRRVASRLNGFKFLIRGNHDSGVDRATDVFQWIKDLYELKVQDPEVRGKIQKIVLCHYCMRVWPSSHHGAWHLCGHSHGGLEEARRDNIKGGLVLDVGVDVCDYKPISYEEVKQIMQWKEKKIGEK
jgi:calcineurin-like phosphoesterase family protein